MLAFIAGGCKMTRTRIALIGLILFSMTVFAERTRLRPGFNSFSAEQDVELGREAAKDAEKQLPLVTNRDASDYVAALGQKLAAKSPNQYKFPFIFKIVDERSINAFALPGGPVYVNRGAIEAADNEAQLAGVMGHEIGHVILRHGTNQASKSQVAQGLAGILGGVLGDRGVGAAIGQLSVFAAGGVLLKYSRDAESQADLMGTQILYDMGYDPKAMAQFFDKLAKEHKGSKTEQFFSNHPIPENRVIKVNEEIRRIGPVPSNPVTDSMDFQRVKRAMLAMPEPKPMAKPAASSNGKPATAPPAPSARMTDLQVSGIQLRHPDNWKPVVQGTNVTLAPAGGVVQGNLAYGMIVDVFRPQNARNLDQATAEFLESLRKGNPSMKVVRTGVRTRVDGQNAQLTEVTNDSPIGGQETDTIVTVMRSNDDLLHFVLVAPAKDLGQYQPAFRAIMDSVRLR
jgi:Zn-dependent protease with chaperone function